MRTTLTPTPTPSPAHLYLQCRGSPPGAGGSAWLQSRRGRGHTGQTRLHLQPAGPHAWSSLQPASACAKPHCLGWRACFVRALGSPGLPRRPFPGSPPLCGTDPARIPWRCSQSRGHTPPSLSRSLSVRPCGAGKPGEAAGAASASGSWASAPVPHKSPSSQRNPPASRLHRSPCHKTHPEAALGCR